MENKAYREAVHKIVDMLLDVASDMDTKNGTSVSMYTTTALEEVDLYVHTWGNGNIIHSQVRILNQENTTEIIAFMEDITEKIQKEKEDRH